MNIRIAAKSGTLAESLKVLRKGTKQKLKFVTKVRVRGGKTYTIKKSVEPKS